MQFVTQSFADFGSEAYYASAADAPFDDIPGIGKLLIAVVDLKTAVVTFLDSAPYPSVAGYMSPVQLKQAILDAVDAAND